MSKLTVSHHQTSDGSTYKYWMDANGRIVRYQYGDGFKFSVRRDKNGNITHCRDNRYCKNWRKHDTVEESCVV